LLHGSGLEESSDFIVGPTGLGVRWLGHVTKKHGSCDNILAGSAEDRGFARPILDDATIDIASSFSSSSTVCACRALLLEGLLKLAQIFSFLIDPILQFMDLLKLHSLVRKELSFISCSRGLNLRWRGIPSSNGCLIL
jgi:hypothetical protein